MGKGSFTSYFVHFDGEGLVIAGLRVSEGLLLKGLVGCRTDSERYFLRWLVGVRYLEIWTMG